MVVARRTPVVPAPPPAHNPAAQGPQRLPRTPTVDAAPRQGSSNGYRLDNHSAKRSKKFRKHAKNKSQRSNFQAFLDFLTKLLLLAFTVCAFSVCPQDTHLQSPICRGLTEYKRIVLDPYVIPPIQAALAHPSIAPHIECAKPYVHRAVEITTPILLRTQAEWNLRVVPQWEKRIIPAWNKLVVPQWNKFVVPQWDKHVAPRIQFVQSTVEPYRLRVVLEYEQRIAPRAQLTFYKLQRWQHQAEPYVLLAVSKTKDGYYAAKPYAIPLAKRLGHALQQFLLSLQEQRKKFVDPHVAKMWEKIKEFSRGEHGIHVAPPDRDSLSSGSTFTVLETLGYEAIPSSTSSHISSSLSEDAAEATEAEQRPIFTEPTLTPVAEPAADTQPTSIPEVKSLLNTESVVTESSRETEVPAAGAAVFVEEVGAATSSLITDDPGATHTSAAEEDASVSETSSSSTTVSPSAEEPTESSASMTPFEMPVPAASAMVPPAHSLADDEIDYDTFYAELGLNEPLGSLSGVEYNPLPPSPPAETEEEKAERLRLKAEETARKRADIEARQTKWEAELQTQMERSTAQLQSRLGTLRVAAAANLATSADIRDSVDELVSEAEKYVKGVEIYLKNLKGENRKADEKLALWDRVVERVSNKFSERLLATEGVVNAWYRFALDKELQEVAAVTAAVREVAERGQLDLGLDYAWLDDVTYNDWQRYHALIGTSEQYADAAASIQNGTHANVAVTNPMVPLFEDLESEVEDVVIGFETRLRRIKRDGERAFSNGPGHGAAQKEELKGSAAEPEVEAEPVVSILPMPREGAREEGRDFSAPVVIGRSQKEVLAALDKAEPEEGVVPAVRGCELESVC